MWYQRQRVWEGDWRKVVKKRKEKPTRNNTIKNRAKDLTDTSPKMTYERPTGTREDGERH